MPREDDSTLAAAAPCRVSPPVPGRPNPEPDPPSDPDEGDEIPDDEDDEEKRRPGRD